MRPETSNPLQAAPAAETPVLALRPVEAARSLGISPRTLWSWSRDRGLPYIKVDRTVLYPVDGLRLWLAEQSLAQAAEGGTA